MTGSARYRGTGVAGHPTTPVSPPGTLAELRAVRGPERVVAAAQAYIAQREQAIAEARRIRDDAVRDLADEHGPAETARRVDLSLSTVKVIRRGR